MSAEAAAGGLSVVPEPAEVAVVEEESPVRQKLNAMLETYELDGKGFASVAAGKLADMLERYLTNRPQDLTAPEPPPDHLLDPVEKYAREAAASSPQIDFRILLPAAYVAMGAVGQGGYWVCWNGLSSWQVAPATEQMIATAPSGAGKTTLLGSLNGPIAAAMSAGEDAVRGCVMMWAEKARAAIADVLEKDRQEAVAAGPEASKEFAAAERGAYKVVDKVASKLMTGILSTYSDSTPEALVSSMIEFGGTGLVKAAEQEILDNLTRYSQQKGATGSLSAWLDGWDGCGYERSRMHTGVETTSALVLSMILLTQTETFYRSFASGAGAAWLDKGLIGRALLVSGEDRIVDELIVEDLTALALAGKAKPKMVDKSKITEVMVLIAETGAVVRAARCLEGRVFKAAGEIPDAATPIGRKGVTVAAAPGVLPRAASLHEIKDSGGSAGGNLGFVMQVQPQDAQDLERMFLWANRVMRMLNVPDVVMTLISRWTYHIARVAGIRTMATVAAAGEEAWNDFWSQDIPYIPSDILADTATRLMSWFIALHLHTAEGLQGRSRMSAVQQDLLQARGRDTSLGGLIMESLSKAVERGEVAFPVAAHEATRLVSRGHGHDYRAGVMAYLRWQWEEQSAGEEGDGYLLMISGRKKGTIAVGGFGPRSLVALTPAGAKAAGLAKLSAVLSLSPGGAAGNVPSIADLANASADGA